MFESSAFYILDISSFQVYNHVLVCDLSFYIVIVPYLFFILMLNLFFLFSRKSHNFALYSRNIMALGFIFKSMIHCEFLHVV